MWNVAMPLPAPALSPAASSTVSTARETYIRRLWAWIAARRPAGLHLEGEALISSSIGPRGDLRGLSLDRSSGNAQLDRLALRSEEHTSELQSLMRNSYAVFCLKKKKT